MKAAKSAGKPKIECRSTTGGPYSRSGHLWGTEHADVPEAILLDDEKMELLAKDPHLEIKVDGRYVSGPRVGGSDGTAEALEQATRANDDLRAELAARVTEADLLRAEIASQVAIADAAQKALAASLTGTPSAKTDDTSPTAKSDDAKSKSSKA